MNTSLLPSWIIALALWLAAGFALADEPPAPSENAAYPQSPAWFKESFLNLPEDIAEAAANGKRVMLYFHQDGCPYCARLIRENFNDPAIAAQTQAGFDVIAINLWGDREIVDPKGETTTEKRLAESLRVQYTPTLLILDEQGGVALRINGYYPKEKFALALQVGAGKAERASMLETAAAAPAGALRDEPFFRPAPYDLAKHPSKQPLLVIFETADCPPCQTMHDRALKDPAVLELIKRFDVVRLDAGTETPVVTPDGSSTTARDWATRLGFAYSPSLYFFDEQGKEVFRIEAFLWSFHFQSALDYVGSGAYREQPNFQRYLRERRDQMQAQGKNVNLKD